jgi:hypothetical protein
MHEKQKQERTETTPSFPHLTVPSVAAELAGILLASY